MLAVYYLTSLKSEIRRQIAKRKTKAETYFNNIYSNSMQFVGTSLHGLIGDLERKMKGFEGKPVEFLKTKECHIEIKELVTALIDKLPQVRDFMVKDKTCLTLMKLLLRKNEFIPSGYLTEYELSKVQFSLSFGFMYKTPTVQIFLLSTFLLMRCVIVYTLCQPLAFDIIFSKDQVVGGMLRLLVDAFYQICRQVVEYYRLKNTQKGNWDDLPSELAYMPAEPVTVDVEDFCKVWDDELLVFLRGEGDFWNKEQLRLREWIEGIRSVMDDHSQSELSFYKTAKSKRLTNNTFKKTQK